MMESEAVASFQKTPHISILFMVLEGLKSVGPALLAFIVFSDGFGRFTFGFALLVALGIALASAMLRWISFDYRFDPEDLVLRSGILSRNERHVPYHRFQNIDLEQNPIHRLLGVAKVRLETASGGKPEAVISVLRLQDVEEMRGRVFAPRRSRIDATHAADATDAATSSQAVAGMDAPTGATDARPGDEPAQEILRNGAGDLALLGLISNKGLLVVAAALGLLQQFGSGFDDPDLWQRWLGDAGSWVGSVDVAHLDPGVTALYLILLVMVFLAATRVLSIVWILVALWGFRLERRGEDLRTAYGLFTRITATLPRHRLQLLSWHESLLHQWTGTASVKVETAGAGAAGGDESKSQQTPGNASRLWLAPILRAAEMSTFLRQVVPDLGEISAGKWQPISPRATRRLFRRSSILLFLLIVATALVLHFTPVDPSWAGLLLLFLPTVWFWCRRWTARTGYALGERWIGFRSGAFGRHTSIVPLGKIQVVAFLQNPFDRRAVMAKVKIDTAGANLSSHRIVIPYLELDEARRLASTLEQRAAETSFHW